MAIKKDLFTVTGPATAEQWAKMVMGRAALVFKHADDFTLPKLGDICLTHGDASLKLGQHCVPARFLVELVTGRGGPETEGIFCTEERPALRTDGPEPTWLVWGLTRNMLAIQGEIRMLSKTYGNNVLGITAKAFKPELLGKVHLRDLWMLLGLQVQSWDDMQARREKTLETILYDILMEDTLVGMSDGGQERKES